MTKICCTCKRMQPLSDFNKSKHVKGGYARRCKECRRTERRRAVTLRTREYHRNWHLRSYYGINAEEYDRILIAQKGRCAICGKEPGKFRFRVDHDHACCPGEKSCGNCIRGLLCMSCNLALERIDNIPDWSERARRYLLKKFVSPENGQPALEG